MGEQNSKPITVTDERGTTTIDFEVPLHESLKLHSYKPGQYLAKDIYPSWQSKKSFVLRIYPHGFNERTEDFVSLWLKKVWPNEELSVRFTCNIKKGHGRVLCSKKTEQILTLVSSLGWSAYCSHSIILNRADGSLKADDLTIVGRIEVFPSCSIRNAEIEDSALLNGSLLELSENFQKLLADGHLTDCTLSVGNQRLQVHKIVLSARSSVFKAMFQSSLMQRRDVSVTDVTFEALEMLVKYMYTGKVENLTFQLTIDIYYAADKYEVFQLRSICSTILSTSLLPENVVSVLLLADLHSDMELRESCLEFIDENLREIKGRPEWIDFMKSHPHLADNALFFRSSNRRDRR